MNIPAKIPRILVVEDEIITARDLQDILEELGYDVPDIASSGSEALDLAAAHRPDLVLMDINLGADHRDGVEIARELRECFHIPVVYLTAYADPATLARASDTAPLGYLTKPFERRELHATIQMALVKRRLDEQLSQSEIWYSTSLSCIGDGVIATDAEGKVKFLNPVAEGLTGWTHAEALGKPLDEVFPLVTSTKQEVPSLSSRVLLHRQIVFLEDGVMLRSRSGAFVPVGDSAAPIRDQHDGSMLGVVVVFRDLSEKQQIDAELERARRLESLGTLAGGLAHDLNNILAIIAGNVSLANIPGAPVEMHTRAFAKIDSAVRRAKALTSQFLTFSKGGEPIRRQVDLAALAEEEMDLIFQDTGSSDARVKHHLEAAPEIWSVEADEAQIRRVLENLLQNAIQSLPLDGGNVTIRLLNCERQAIPVALLSTQASPESNAATHFVQMQVIDTGCGISSENLAHVCDPYFTTRSTGNGLGLSVCHSIARKHHGFLQIQSVLGQGTRAVIYLPASSSSGSTPPPSGTPGSGLNGAVETLPAKKNFRVLVMDDEPMMRDLLTAMLGYLGHRVTAAATGEEALDLYRNADKQGDPFDVVCIDLVNKIGMGGEQMMERLRALDPQVIAVVCSGYSDHPIMANYRAFGFSGCLLKPVNMDDFAAALHGAAARHPAS